MTLARELRQDFNRPLPPPVVRATSPVVPIPDPAKEREKARVREEIAKQAEEDRKRWALANMEKAKNIGGTVQNVPPVVRGPTTQHGIVVNGKDLLTKMEGAELLGIEPLSFYQKALKCGWVMMKIPKELADAKGIDSRSIIYLKEDVLRGTGKAETTPAAG